MNTALLRKLRDKSGRPGARVIVSGSPMINSARNRMSLLKPQLLAVTNDFIDKTYTATREAHDLTVTKAGLKEAQTATIGGTEPKTVKQWIREFSGQWLGALQDLTVTAAADGKDLNEAERNAERAAADKAALIARRFNGVLLTAGGAPMRVAVTET